MSPQLIKRLDEFVLQLEDVLSNKELARSVSTIAKILAEAAFLEGQIRGIGLFQEKKANER